MGSVVQLSRTNGSERGAAALAMMLEKSPLIRYLEDNGAFQEEATEGAYRVANATSSIQTRGVGGGYTATALTPEDKINTQLRFHGGAVKIDATHIADSERGLSDIRAYLDERVPEEFEDFVEGFEQYAMRSAGDGTPAKIKGLSAILNGTDDIPGFTDVKGVVNAASYSTGTTPKSFDISNSDNWPRFMKMFRLTKLMVPNANGLLVAPALHAAICTIADAMHASSETRDRFGYTVRTIDGLPIIPLLDTSILLTEPDDTSTPKTETTSMYFARAGENQLSMLTNSGLDWTAFDITPNQIKSGQEEWEFRATWRLKKRNCIVRVRNIKIG